MSLPRQAWLLTSKNLRLLWISNGGSTVFSAFIVPVVFMIFMAYSRFLFTPFSRYGIESPSPLRSLGQGMDAASGGRNTIVFVNSGHSGGAIDDVINKVAAPARSSGHNVQLLTQEVDLGRTCRSSLRGSTACYAAAVFYSSPSEGKGGSWNYTLRGDGAMGVIIDAKTNKNDFEIYLLPLQHSIDAAIASLNQTTGQNAIPPAVNSYLYTTLTQPENKDRIRVRYMDSVISILAVAFLEGLAAVTYHLPGFMAAERESGMSQLLEAMMPGHARWKPTCARILAYHWAFSISYFPGWIMASLIIGYGVFSKTSLVIVIILHVLAGLALVSFSILGASFFKRTQMSGISVTLSFLVLGIIAQVVKNKPTATITVLSFLFTPITYVNFLILMARYEKMNLGFDLLHAAPESRSKTTGITLLCFMIIQFLVYPLLGALVERSLYGTLSSARRTTTGDGTNETVRLKNFTKQYVPNWFKRTIGPLFGLRYETVFAVSGLTLTALKGQIVVLLGPNGSGKSTTLDTIAGLNQATSGSLEIDGTGGLGICPQKNVLWDEMSVIDHIGLFSALKSPGVSVSDKEIRELIRAIDLVAKTNSRAKTLSGGQKRKLQLGLMLSGGSQVCCVDEVSSGLDPLSRRKIWDIILDKRESRTMILTTHFLDEADVLADHIAIMSHGTLRVQGSSVQLKSTLGGGYRIHLRLGPEQQEIPDFEDVQGVLMQDEVVYTTSSPRQVADILSQLQRLGFDDYHVSGPTIEDVFMDVVDEAADIYSLPVEKSGAAPEKRIMQETSNDQQLSLFNGTRTSVWTQTWILFRKRCTILTQSWLPYATAVVIPIAVAGLTLRFLQEPSKPGCSPAQTMLKAPVNTFTSQIAFDMVVGPSNRFMGADLDRFGRLFLGNTSASALTRVDLKKSIHTVDTVGEFNDYINHHQGNLTPGGVFLGDANSAPTFAYVGEKGPQFSIFTQNVLDVFLSNISMHTQYAAFDTPWTSGAGKALEFIVVLGLALTVYPAFFALYPTFERTRQVRALHYSNGVRPLPLWLAYLFFDGAFVVLISAIVVIILATVSDQLYHVAYLFPVFVLAGLASTLSAYIMSQLTSTQLSAFAAAAFGQVAFFLIYLVTYMVVLLYTPASNVDSTLLIVTYVLCAVSPACNVIRTLFLALNVFGVDCTGGGILRSDMSSLSLFGGPLLFLSLQIVLFTCLIIWNENGSSWRLPGRKSGKKRLSSHDIAAQKEGMADENCPPEAIYPGSEQKGLRVVHVSKSFGSLEALDNVSLDIGKGEVLALLGPNGAGKSTLISLIRGDIPPSGRDGDIFVQDISVVKDRSSARAHMGVCPQIDAIDQLTVLQHLQFYGRIRGVPDVNHNVRTVMRAVGIEQYGSRRASELSGGNKRKMGLAIALMGNPSLLLLDEPGSGLDATSKRTMWQALASVAPGRSVLLTTHSMEEADALPGRIAILAKRMLATGSSHQLRAQNGISYYIHLVLESGSHATSTEINAVKSWIGRYLPGAIEDGAVVHGQLRFRLPKGQDPPVRQPGSTDAINSAGEASPPQVHMSQVFRLLEDNKALLGIKYYSVGETTLEQVFLRIVNQHNTEDTTEKEPPKKFWRWHF